jgi:hypothetical protein
MHLSDVLAYTLLEAHSIELAVVIEYFRTTALLFDDQPLRGQL